MPLAVLRTRKMKSAKDLTLAQQHNERSRETPNADPARQHLNQVLAGVPSEDLAEAVARRIEQAQPGKKVRANAVLAIDTVLSASPEYFAVASAGERGLSRNKGATYAGRFDKAKTDAWAKASVEWLQAKYGRANVVRAELHLDETTPHIHAVFVPIDGRGRLNARGVIGGSKNVLRDLQTEYAGALKHLGIERGLAGARAAHGEVDKFYAVVNQPVPAIPAAKTFDAERLVERSSMSPLNVWSSKTTDGQAVKVVALAEHKKVAMALAKAQEQAKGARLAQKQAKELMRSNAQLTQRLELTEAERDALKADAARLRTIPALDVLERVYGIKGPGDTFEVNGRAVLIEPSGKHRVGGPKGKLSGSALDLVREIEGWPADAGGAQKAREKLLVEFPAQAVTADTTHHLAERAAQQVVAERSQVLKERVRQAHAKGQGTVRFEGRAHRITAQELTAAGVLKAVDQAARALDGGREQIVGGGSTFGMER